MILLDGMRFHHFGLAALVPEQAVAFLRAMGYSCGEAVHDPLQGVQLRWCMRQESPPVEIVSTAGEGGPLRNLLATQGTSFYHLGYEIDGDAASAVEGMRASGLRVLTMRAPLPAVLFGGRLVSFHQVQGFGLVELIEPATSDCAQASE